MSLVAIFRSIFSLLFIFLMLVPFKATSEEVKRGQHNVNNSTADDGKSLTGYIELSWQNSKVTSANFDSVSSQLMVTDSSLLSRLPLGAAGKPVLTTLIEVNTSGQSQANQLEYSELSFSSGPEFLVNNLGPIQWVNPYGEFEWARSNNVTQYHSYGIGVTIGGNFGSKGQMSWSLDTDVLYRDYKKPATFSFVDGRSGPNYFIKGEITAPVSDSIQIIFSSEFERQWAKVSSSSYFENITTLEIVRSFQGPFTSKASSSLLLSGYTVFRRYDEANPLIDPFRREENLDFTVSGKLSLAVTESISATLRLSQRWGTSSIAGFESNKTTIETGVAYQF